MPAPTPWSGGSAQRGASADDAVTRILEAIGDLRVDQAVIAERLATAAAEVADVRAAVTALDSRVATQERQQARWGGAVLAASTMLSLLAGGVIGQITGGDS